MIKSLIKPIQETLLRKGFCPGCTYQLDKIKEEYPLSNNKVLIQCKCQRMFIRDKNTNTYRRASFEEAQEAFSNQQTLENNQNKK